MGALDEALALRPSASNTWLAFADPRYQSQNGMFGGWTSAIGLAAILQASDGTATPSALSINFLGGVTPGDDVAIAVELLGGSRSIEHWRAEVRSPEQDGAQAVSTAVLTRRRESDGHTEPSMPDSPGPEGLAEFQPPDPHRHPGCAVHVRPTDTHLESKRQPPRHHRAPLLVPLTRDERFGGPWPTPHGSLTSR